MIINTFENKLDRFINDMKQKNNIFVYLANDYSEGKDQILEFRVNNDIGQEIELKVIFKYVSHNADNGNSVYDTDIVAKHKEDIDTKKFAQLIIQKLAEYII